MEATLPAPEQVARDPVVRWRFDELARAGYALSSTVLLSERPDVDLHTAVELLRNGCPETTALRILL
jgi:hypothetical protein